MYNWNGKGLLSVGKGKEKKYKAKGEEVTKDMFSKGAFDKHLNAGDIIEAVAEKKVPKKEIVEPDGPDEDNDGGENSEDNKPEDCPGCKRLRKVGNSCRDCGKVKE